MSIRMRCAPRAILERRRNHLMRKRSELIAHIQNTASQYNLPPFEHRITKKHQRVGLLEHFPDVQVRNRVALDVAVIDHYDELRPSSSVTSAPVPRAMTARASPWLALDPGL